MKKSHLLTLVAAALFLALIGASFWDVLQGEESSPPAVTMAEESPPPTATAAEAPIPPVLGELPLVEAVTGNEGLAQVSRMHGKDVGLVRGYIAQYADNGARATLWLGWAESEAAAQSLTDRMTTKIGPDHPVFQGLQALTFGGRTVYTATGQGQQHYYFRSGMAVVWVTVDSAAAQEVVHDTLRLFP
jgi:hypothetical protein